MHDRVHLIPNGATQNTKGVACLRTCTSLQVVEVPTLDDDDMEATLEAVQWDDESEVRIIIVIIISTHGVQTLLFTCRCLVPCRVRITRFPRSWPTHHSLTTHSRTGRAGFLLLPSPATTATTATIATATMVL